MRLAIQPHLLPLVCATLLVACSGDELPGTQTNRPEFTSSEQLLVDKESDHAAIVLVRGAEIRWVILEDGDHVPLVVADCEMEQDLSDSNLWTRGTTQKVIQFDHSGLFRRPIAPPAIVGRRYLLWVSETKEDGEIAWPAPWLAHPRGVLLVRGHGEGEFVFWKDQNYLLSEVREVLSGSRPLPLDEISDPRVRREVAKARLRREDPGDPDAFVRGLMASVREPEGEAKNVEPDAPDPTSTRFGMGGGEGRPHAIWYRSLAVLRDFGRNEKRRPAVVAALTPLAKTARPHVRLAVSLALVDLGSDAGREALIRGFETDSGPVGRDPEGSVNYPGRYPYDESSVTACAHALARLGDDRGLKHAEPVVRLAAAEAFEDTSDADVREALKELAAELDPEIEKLRSSGELSRPRKPGDHRNRAPSAWTRIHRLLARGGDDRSLRQLVDVYLIDATTYPKEEPPLMPTGRLVSWSRGPYLSTAIRGSAGSPTEVLERLERLFEKDARWNEPALRTLRTWLAGSSNGKSRRREKKIPSRAEIEAMLAEADPARRARGLAAAGYHRLEAFFDRVLDAAISGKGVERRAAVYGLGFYGREVPNEVLRGIMESDDLDLCLSTLEVATRKDAGRFAAEAMALARRVAAASREGASHDWSRQRRLSTLPRTLSRLARGPIPSVLLDGLDDPDPIVRHLVIQALRLGGNPDAIPRLEALTEDAIPAIAEASQAALRALGPSGE